MVWRSVLNHEDLTFNKPTTAGAHVCHAFKSLTLRVSCCCAAALWTTVVCLGYMKSHAAPNGMCSDTLFKMQSYDSSQRIKRIAI